MDIGDIEKFFNENFFKKIVHRGNRNRASTEGASQKDKEQFMHGVPEAAYEPTVMDDSRKEVSNCCTYMDTGTGLENRVSLGN